MADSLLDETTLPPDNEMAEMESIIAKWKDKPQDELLTAKARSDLYIKTMTARFDDLKKDYLQLREQHQTSAQLKDLIDRLEKERGTPGSNDDTQNTNRDTVPPSIKPEDIENLVNQKMTEAELRRKQLTNFTVVEAKLKEQFGENYQPAYKQRLDTLGLTKEFADDLARNHPTVFMKTFELDQARQVDTFAPPRTQQRSSAFAPRAQVRDWKYYQELKKNDPRMYLDPKIAIQMHEDAIALGDAFGMPSE